MRLSWRPLPAGAGTSTRLQETLVSFSLRRNGAALLSTARSGDTMGCLHGLRVLSISWVVLLHSFYMEAVSPNINRAVVPKVRRGTVTRWARRPVSEGCFHVQRR